MGRGAKTQIGISRGDLPRDEPWGPVRTHLQGRRRPGALPEDLEPCCTKSDWQVLAWCLMNNHVGVATVPQKQSEEGEDRAEIQGENDHRLQVNSWGIVHGGLDACMELAIAGSPWPEVTAI